MAGEDRRNVAIIDYGVGNIFSIKQACRHVGMHASTTSSINEIMDADAVILPGVGAFGDAMSAIKSKDLMSPLKEIAASKTPLIGICLGMQLLMTESCEFGTHRGLGIIDGSVVRFESPLECGRKLKVPMVGWSQIRKPPARQWTDTPLRDINNEEYMYFVHSFYAKPVDDGLVLSTSQYGNIEFCSSFRFENVIAFQFHPERSGVQGLKIYHALRSLLYSGSW